MYLSGNLMPDMNWKNDLCNKKERKYWIISQFFAEDTGTGYSMTRIAEGLAKYYSINVICGQPHYLSRKNLAPREEYRNGVFIKRIYSTPFVNNNLLLKLVNMLSASVSLFFSILRNIKIGDIVLFTNLPPVAPFFVSIGCKMKNAKSILRIDDVYPEILALTGLLRSSTFVYRFFDWIYNYLYESVDSIVVLGQDTKKLLEKKNKKLSNRIFYIPNAGAIQKINPIPKTENSLLITHGLTEKFIIKYGGHMGRSHDLETIIGAAENLIDEYKIHFLFIGDGPRKKWLEKFVAKRDLRNVTILQYLPRSDLSISVNACDVGIISMIKGMAGISVPGRIYDLMAAGKPIIIVSDSNSEISQIVEQNNIGWVIPPGEIQILSQTIMDISRTSYSKLKQMGDKARKICEDMYSYDHEISRYSDILVNVLEDIKC